MYVFVPHGNRLTGCSPFLGDNDQETIQNVVSGEYDFPEEEEEGCTLSEDARKFISSLLIPSPRWGHTSEPWCGSDSIAMRHNMQWAVSHTITVSHNSSSEHGGWVGGVGVAEEEYSTPLPAVLVCWWCSAHYRHIMNGNSITYCSNGWFHSILCPFKSNC